jgi:hypothetical protein
VMSETANRAGVTKAAGTRAQHEALARDKMKRLTFNWWNRINKKLLRCQDFLHIFDSDNNIFCRRKTLDLDREYFL